MEGAVCRIIGLQILSAPIAVLAFKLESNLKQRWQSTLYLKEYWEEKEVVKKRTREESERRS